MESVEYKTDLPAFEQHMVSQVRCFLMYPHIQLCPLDWHFGLEVPFEQILVRGISPIKLNDLFLSIFYG
jgi:hypothetical protein